METLKKFIGTKEVMAAPMDEATAVDKGFARKNEDNHEWRQGFHVQYKNPDGSTYDSWSPIDVFASSYHLADNFKDRMNIEYHDLSDRLGKLRNLLGVGYKTLAEKVGTAQASLLVAQFRGMELYHDALQARLINLDVNDKLDENCKMIDGAKERYFYAVASFMRKDKENIRSLIDLTVKNDKGSNLFPLMKATEFVQENYSDVAAPMTIQFETYFEISKEDYEAYNKFKGLTKTRSL